MARVKYKFMCFKRDGKEGMQNRTFLRGVSAMIRAQLWTLHFGIACIVLQALFSTCSASGNKAMSLRQKNNIIGLDRM